MKDYKRISLDTAKGASRSALLAGAGSVASGLATTSLPIKIAGLITIGSTTVVSAPVVASMSVGGAVLGGIAAAFYSNRRQQKIEEEFDSLINMNTQKNEECI